jgi:microcystin-dependent protein
MKKIISSLYFGFVIFLCFTYQTNAQSTTITPGNNQPSLTATSTNNGLIVPKITLTASLASASPVTNPAAGLLIYNVGNNVAKGFYYWTGTAWQYLATAIPFSTTTPINITSNNIKLNSGTAFGQLLTWDGNHWINTNPKLSQSIDNRQPYLTLNFCIALQGIFPSRNGIDPFIGELAIFSFNFAPKRWAMCNGQLLPINQNQALFSLLGTTYGGDGRVNFALPDFRGRIPIGMGQGSGLSNYELGQRSGTETITIDNKY